MKKTRISITIAIVTLMIVYSIDPGIDTVFLFSDGKTDSTRLNDVNWKSKSISLSFGYGF